MAASTTVRERLALRAEKCCAVPNCYQHVNKFSRYCRYHDQVDQRTGHPLGQTISITQLKPYRKIAKEFLNANLEHPGIVNAQVWLVDYLSKATLPRNLSVRSSPDERLQYWRHHLWIRGVESLDILAVLIGMHLLRYYFPQTFKSDRHFWHQLAIRVLRLSRSSIAPGGHRWHRRVTVGVRERFTDILKQSRLMAVGLKAANQIIQLEEKTRLRPIKGFDVPFSS